MRGKIATTAGTIVRSPALAIWLLLVSLIFVCCGAPVDRTLEQIVEQTYPLDSTASISVTNQDGSIRIYGGGDELKVQAIKKAYTAERLNGIKVNIVAQPKTVSITTDYPPKKTRSLSDRSGTVDYIIIVPETAQLVRVELANGEVAVEGLRGGSVHANLGSGLLFARNCFSDLELTVASGNLNLSYDWWEQVRFSVDATVTRGHVLTFLPGDAAFRLRADAPHGKIANDFTAKEQRRPEPTNNIDMSVGDGRDADVKIRATNGNIRIAEVNP